MSDYEVTAPADSGSSVLTENAKVRGNWDVIQNTLDIDHFAMAKPLSATDGQHKQVTIPEIDTTPTGVDNTGILYVEETAAKAELFYQDQDDNAVQLTSKGTPTSFIKAFVSFSVTGAIATGSFNVASVAKNIIGANKARFYWDITFSTPFADTNYTILGNAVTDQRTRVLIVVEKFVDKVRVMIIDESEEAATWYGGEVVIFKL